MSEKNPHRAKASVGRPGPSSEDTASQPRLRAVSSTHESIDSPPLSKNGIEPIAPKTETNRQHKSSASSSTSRYWSTVLSPSRPQQAEEPPSYGGQSAGRPPLASRSSTETSTGNRSPAPVPSSQTTTTRSKSRQKQKLVCPVCAMQFDNRFEKTNHMQNVHNPEETFPCRFPGCRKVFGHRSSRSRHETAHRWVRK